MAQGKQTSNIYVTEQCSSFVDLDYQYSISQTHRQDSLFAQGLNCPNLEKYDNPQNVFEYVVQNMIVIPKTNILIINTMQQSSTGSSYVYYVDLASAQIINTIKPSYQIINMRYHKKTDQIVVQNKGNIFLTDPYTLKVLNSFSGFNFSQLDLIEGTKYIIVSLFHDQCWVIDISQQISVFHLNNLPDIETFPDGSALTQYITKCYTLSTDFYGNPTNRRFVINHEGETEKVVLLNNNQVQLIDRKNFGSYPFDSTKQKPPLTYAQLDEFAVFYQVKYTTNQFFVKTTDDASDYITTFQMYPLNQLDYSIDIYTKYNHYWGHFSDVLDPFFFNNSVWVGLPEPTKAISKNYIISLINCWTGDIIYLVSDSGDDTAIKSAYGLASLDDQDNQEYIVFDDYGNIYTWDLSKPNFPFKSKIDFDCPFSYSAEIFQYQKIKKLLFFCPDNYIYSFDYLTLKYQKIVQLSVFPTALKAISRLQMVLIGDYDTGVGYVFKYDPVNDQFNIFLKFKPTKTNDKLSFIDILDDNTIWFQYQYSTIFYNINDCLNDPTQCLECTQQYYFDTTNQYDENGLYGNGQQENTFTTSYNFFTSMIKAQLYQNFLFDVANMNVEIITSPENILVLNPNFMNFDFNNIISLSFQSLKPGNYAFISYFNQLNLQDYNLIKFQDVAILFDLSQSDKCGLNLQNIQNGVVFNNIQLKPLVQPPQAFSCQQIHSDNTPLNIQNYVIYNEDLTNHSSILSSLNNKDIKISNFSLLNCTLGDNFSILSQISNVDVYITNLTINDNICPKDSKGNQTSFLFTDGLFYVDGMTMNRNVFCRKSIFSTKALLQQSNYNFKFINIFSQNNIFQVRTTYIFFNALYSILIQPDHQLIVQNVTFSNNQLSVQDSKDLNTAHYFETIKISSINMQNINLTNHFDISFGLMQSLDSAVLSDFYCTNDQSYLDQIPNQQTSSCIQLYEVLSANIQNINVIKKKSYDSNLIFIKNFFTKISSLNIKIANFSDLSLIQNGINTCVSPIFIQSGYEIDVQIDQAIFQNIFLKTIDYSISYSTLALQVINYLGTLEIKNTQFLNSYSQSIYGFVQAQTNTLILDTVTFNNQTFYSSTKQQLFKQQGGFINAQIEILNITKSQFVQSTAAKGAFLYLLQSGKKFLININNTIFNEGYASLDGGALFIDTGNNQIQFNCFNCQFSNIYTFLSQACSIGLQKYSQINNNTLNSIIFEGGYIKNVKGVLDNYFIDVVITNLQFLQISQILSEAFVSNSQPYQIYSLLSSNQQPALISNLQYSTLMIQNCTISNLKKTSFQTTYPSLVNSYASQITIQNTNIENLVYITIVLQLVQSQISLIYVKFQNINQLTQNVRLIQSTEYQTPNQNGATLISASQSNLNISQQSLFSNISCSQNCNGGSIQVIQGNLQINQTVFQNISSNFGGAIFILGLKQGNSITHSQFIGCQSQNDGGAIYLSAQQGDIYGQYWPHSYAKSAKFSCTRCDQIKNNIWIVVLMTIWTLISMCLAIKGDVDVLREKVAIRTIQKNLSRKCTSQNRRQSSVQFKTMSFSNIHENKSILRQRSTSNKFKMEFNKNEDKSGIFIKMLTNYVQIVGSIATFNLTIPSGIFEFPQSLGQPLKQTMNSLDCALQELNVKMPIIYVRMFFSLTLPVIYMILFVVYEYLKNVSGDINESNATLKQINNAQQDYEKQIELKQIQSNEIQAMQNSNSSPFQQDKVEKQRQSKLQKGNNKVTINQINSIYLENCLCKQQEQDFKLQEQDLKQILSSQNEKNQSDNNILLLSGQIEQIYRGNQHERANTDQCFIDSNKFILGLQPQGTLQEINNQNENREAKFDNQTQLFVEETEEIQYTEQNDLNVQNEDNLQSRSPDYPKNNTQRYQFMLESKINLLKDIQQDLFEKKSQDQCLKKELGLQAIILEQDTESLQNIIQDNQNVNKKNQQISIQLIEEKNNIDKGGLDFNSNKLITAQHVASTKIDQNFDTQNLIIFENSQDIIYDQDIEVKVLK
ncbi:hypothetical protein ABPG73_021036 [Tetrahymena malaccensis]